MCVCFCQPSQWCKHKSKVLFMVPVVPVGYAPTQQHRRHGGNRHLPHRSISSYLCQAVPQAIGGSRPQEEPLLPFVPSELFYRHCVIWVGAARIKEGPPPLPSVPGYRTFASRGWRLISLVVLQSRFGDKPLESHVLGPPQNGTVVLEGLVVF